MGGIDVAIPSVCVPFPASAPPPKCDPLRYPAPPCAFPSPSKRRDRPAALPPLQRSPAALSFHALSPSSVRTGPRTCPCIFGRARGHRPYISLLASYRFPLPPCLSRLVSSDEHRGIVPTFLSSPLTASLSRLTSCVSPLASHLLRLTSCVSPLTEGRLGRAAYP